MSAGEPFATLEDLKALYPDLAARQGAGQMLAFASVKVRARCHGEPRDPEAAKHVVLDMVRTALLAPTGTAPATQVTQTAGPYSSTVQYANPTGDLYWKRSYDADLGLSGTSLGCVMPATRWSR